MKKNFLVKAFATILFTAFFVSCSNLTQSKEKKSDIAYITLDSVFSSARDIFPSESNLDKNNLTDITLTGTWSPDTAYSREETLVNNASVWAAVSSSIPIQTGTWDFTLTAKLNNIDFSGTLENQEITSGTTQLNFTLAATTANYGGLALTVKIDNYADAITASGAILTAEINIKQNGTSVYTDSKDFASNTVSFSRSISESSERIQAGIYDLEIKFTVDGLSEVLNNYNEKLHIVAGIVTTKEIDRKVNPVYDIAYKYVDDTLVSVGSSQPALYTRKTTPISLPATVSKPGYKFLGWYIDKEDSTTALTTVSTSTPGPQTFYARFTPKSYTVKHYFQPVGTSTDPEDYVQDLDNAPDQTITISGNPSNETTTATAYTITGFENQTITQATSIADDDSTVVNVYYNRQSFNVSYTDGQGNTLSGGGQYQFGSTFDLIFDNYTPPAYHDFTGWSDGTNTYTEEEPSFEMPAVNVVLEAQSEWTEHYINLYIYGGALGEHTGKYTITITKETTTVYEIGSDEWKPTRSHYTFGGWYTDKECTTLNTVEVIDPYEEDDHFHDWNFYAKWTQPAETPEGFVYVYGATVSETVTGSPVLTGTSVQIPDLYVCEHEVTQGEYETYCKYSGSYTPSTLGNSGANKPVFLVNWYDAIIYCNLRSADEGLNSVYTISGKTDPSQWPDVVSTTSNGKTVYCSPSSIPTAWSEVSCDFTANGYRLPKEVEWEYCALGGEAGIPSTLYTYSGSNDANDVAWYKGNSGNVLHDVKTKIANSIGIYDMSGNEGEWCWDFYNGSTNRVIRDSSFSSDLQYITVFDRGSNGPDVEINGTGFRVFRTAQ